MPSAVKLWGKPISCLHVNWVRRNTIGGISFSSMDMDDFYGAFCTGDIYPLLTAINEQFTAPLPPLIQRQAKQKNIFTMSTSSYTTTTSTTQNPSIATITELFYVYNDTTEFPANRVNKSLSSSTNTFTFPTIITTQSASTSTSTRLPQESSTLAGSLTPTATVPVMHTTPPSILVPPFDPIKMRTSSMISVPKKASLSLGELATVNNISHKKQRYAVNVGSEDPNKGFKTHTQRKVGINLPRKISPVTLLSKNINTIKQPQKVSLKIPTTNPSQMKRQRLMNDILTFVFSNDRSGFRQGPVLPNTHKTAAQFLSKERLKPVLPDIKLDGNMKNQNQNRKSLQLPAPARTARLVLSEFSASDNDMLWPRAKRMNTANLVIPDNLKTPRMLVSNA